MMSVPENARRFMGDEYAELHPYCGRKAVVACDVPHEISILLDLVAQHEGQPRGDILRQMISNSLAVYADFVPVDTGWRAAVDAETARQDARVKAFWEERTRLRERTGEP